MINRYNGKKFRFEVYLDNIVSTTPKFGNGKKNNSIQVSVEQPQDDGSNKIKDFTFFYEETEEPNGLEVVIPTKKFAKKEFFRAIEEQLMYIPNVKFQFRAEGAITYEDKDIAAKVIYRDNNIILSESTVFNAPHILLGAGDGLINYGILDFDALELERKKGAVGLILDINDVEVTPPRESIVYSPKTRTAVVEIYNKIVETATNLVNSELAKADDYWGWMKKAASIKSALVQSSSGDSSVLQKLAGVIDASSVNKIFFHKKGMNKLYVSDVKEMVGDKLLIRVYKYDRWGRKVNRIKIKSISTIAGLTAYVTDGASDKYKDRYLYEVVENKQFIVVKRSEGWEEIKKSALVGNSTELLSYDDIKVPEDVMDNYLAEEISGSAISDDESDGGTQIIDSNRLAKLRKLEEKILFHSAKIASPISYTSNEIKINDILSKFALKKVVYGSFDNRQLMNNVMTLFPYKMFDIIDSYRLSYTINQIDYNTHYDKVLNFHDIKSVDAILISKDNQKYFSKKSNFEHITDFIIEDYENKKLTFNPMIRLSLTVHYIGKLINSFRIYVPHRAVLKSKIAKTFYGEDFLNTLILNEVFHSKLDTYVIPFFKNAVSYEMGKDSLDQTTLNDYLTAVDDKLPDELCDIIDEIEDIHIVDVDLIRKTEEYCKFYSKFNPILHHVNNSSDVKIYKLLEELVHDRENKPIALGSV